MEPVCKIELSTEVLLLVREAGHFLTAHCGDALNLAQGLKPLAATQFRFSKQTPKVLPESGRYQDGCRAV
jgi:hypothetical protein